MFMTLIRQPFHQLTLPCLIDLLDKIIILFEYNITVLYFLFLLVIDDQQEVHVRALE